MPKCWKIECRDCNGEAKIQYICADTVTTNTNTNIVYNQCQVGSRYLLTIDGVSQNAPQWTMVSIDSITVVDNSDYRPQGITIYGNCDACKNIKEYDCINGACTKKNVYNTPGLYPNLSACEIACGTGCSGKCISNSDWAQIEGLSGQLKNRNCN